MDPFHLSHFKLKDQFRNDEQFEGDPRDQYVGGNWNRLVLPVCCRLVLPIGTY